ncbi:adenylosuccinate lyase [Aestuariivivens insulae]|uniref:adenylosuccinate lyase n=1 Tax=Aestuariivivens insulae TaxID=1621988 RepID=UPI001F594EDE|nr:adenylosuccinate lyase [Aestuariivivens insulae]
MNTEDLHEELNYVNASRKNRLKYAHLILNDLTLFPKLLDIMFMVDDKLSCRAAWILEFVCIEYPYAIVPYLDTFSNNLKKVHLDSAIRPVSKVCSLIAKAYCSKTTNPLKKALTPTHKELMVEACFDWMISDQKVAAKVHAMETLFLLGKDSNWIHKELALILEQDFHTQSAGFKARAKRILKRIKQENL